MKTHLNNYILLKISIIACFLLQSLSGSAQTATSTTLDNSCYSINGLYVWGLYAYDSQTGNYLPAERILGNTTLENNLLQFIRNNGYNYLICYELNLVLADNTLKPKFAAFVKKARAQYGLQQVGAAIATKANADIIVSYNKSHAADERVDVLNLEAEFWNDPDPATSLQGSVDLLTYFGQVGHPINMETEVYIGRFNNDAATAQAEGTKLANAVDRVLIHYYRTTDVAVYDYQSERLKYLGTGRTGSKLKIAPIFSSEGTNNTADVPFMGDWLFTHPQEQAFNSWIAGYNAETGAWKNNLDLMGATWFQYSRFIQPINSHITTQPVSQTACLGQTKTFAAASSAIKKVYYWTKNGRCLTDGANIAGSKTATLTISNITKADTGNYFCRVVSYDASNPGTFASDQAKLTLACVAQSPYGGTLWPIPGIIQAEDYDLGGQDVAYNDLTAANEGGVYRTDAVDVETCTDGASAFDVGYIVAGEWLSYSVKVQTTTKYSINVRAAAIAAGEKVHIEIDGVNVSGTITIPNTTGWDTWQTITVDNISLTAGKHIMRVMMETGDFNFNYVEFKKSVTTDIIDAKQDYKSIVFPNPAHHELNIIDDGVNHYRFVSLTGITIQEGMIPESKKVNIESLTSGSYILELTGESKKYRVHINKK